MTQPTINAIHQQSLARLPYESIGLLDEVNQSIQDSEGELCGNLVDFYELDRPLGPKDQLLFTVVEVAHILSLSRTKVYELLYAGELPSIKIGASRRVRKTDLETFVTNLELAN